MLLRSNSTAVFTVYFHTETGAIGFSLRERVRVKPNGRGRGRWFFQTRNRLTYFLHWSSRAQVPPCSFVSPVDLILSLPSG